MLLQMHVCLRSLPSFMPGHAIQMDVTMDTKRGHSHLAANPLVLELGSILDKDAAVAPRLLCILHPVCLRVFHSRQLPSSAPCISSTLPTQLGTIFTIFQTSSCFSPVYLVLQSWQDMPQLQLATGSAQLGASSISFHSCVSCITIFSGHASASF